MFQTLAVHKAPQPTHATPAFSTEVSLLRRLGTIGAGRAGTPCSTGQATVADEYAFLAL